MADGAAQHVAPHSDAVADRKIRHFQRIVALEVRAHKVGFVVFAGPTRLLDWGVRSFTSGGNRAAIVTRRIGPILDQYAPAYVVLRRRRDSVARAHQDLPVVLRTISGEARRRSIKVRRLSTRTVRAFFLPHGYVTKHQIASAIAELFAELGWKLPPKRKPWQREDHNMVIFDAAAAGIAFLGKLGRSEQEVPE